jgi:hypothetical protein
LRCTFAGPAGGGFISSTWLTAFEGEGEVSVQTAAATTTPAESWKVLLDVNRPATTPTHEPYRARLDFK